VAYIYLVSEGETATRIDNILQDDSGMEFEKITINNFLMQESLLKERSIQTDTQALRKYCFWALLNG
jgi:hypothetical protein